jgi:hypothetical protein
VCKYFRQVWEQSAYLKPALRISRHEQVTDFPRIDLYNRKQPSMASRRPCKCKHSDDQWKCWSRTRAAELYGGARHINGPELLVDYEALEEEDR